MKSSSIIIFLNIIFLYITCIVINVSTVSAQTVESPACLVSIKAFYFEVEQTYLTHPRSRKKDERALSEVVKFLSRGLNLENAECASEVLYRSIDVANRLPFREVLLKELVKMSDSYDLEQTTDGHESLFTLARGTLELNQGDLNKTLLLTDSSLYCFANTISSRHTASAHLIRGYAYEGLGEFELGRQNFLESYRIYKKFPSLKTEQVKAINAAALASEKLGEYDAAISYINLINAIQGSNDLQEGEMRDEYVIYLTLAKANFYLGKVEEAFEAGQVAMNLAKKRADMMRIARANLVLGELAFHNADFEKAESYLTDAAKGLNVHGDARFKARTIDLLSQLHKSKGDYVKAFDLNQEYIHIKDSLNEVNFQYAIQDVKQDADNARIMQDLIRAEANQRALEEEQVQSRLTTMVVASLFIALLCLLVAVVTKYKANKKVEKKLELEVAARTEELERQKEVLKAQSAQLEQSNQELERFAYVASHDLKTPLRNISSFLGLIKRRIGQESLEKAQEYFDIVGDSCKQMDQLISDVLEFSKVGSDFTSKLESVNIRTLTDGIVKQFSCYTKGKNASIEVNGVAELTTHSTYVSQVIKNLIENGLKYNDSTFPKVSVDIKQMDEQVTVTVIDNGIGISEEDYQCIFEMFKRLHCNDVYKGTGVGLAVCAKIAEKMGGSIQVDSVVGEGSTFVLTLPVDSLPKPEDSAMFEDNTALQTTLS